MISRIAAIQMTSTLSVEENMKIAKKLLQQAKTMGAQLAILPEMFALQGKMPMDNVNIAESFGNGMIQDFLQEQAMMHQLWIVGGTIPIQCDDRKDKMRAACLVFNDHGERVARYDKMHLFDVKLSETESYQESANTEPGKALGIVDTPFGRLGLAVCYDIRFSTMFHQMFHQGVEILAVPSAFAVKTGIAHFEILMRARAIENFSYLFAACQAGSHQNGRKTYGHSLAVSPWGDVLAQLSGDEEGVIVADIDLNALREIRKSIPVHCYVS